MSNPPNTPIDRSDDGALEAQLPPDLVGISAALDALATSDRAAAAPGTERRLFVATHAKLAATVAARVAPADAALDQLAEVDRRAARSTLEDRIFMASRAALGAGVGRAPAPLRVVVRRPLVRVAAGLLVASGIVATYLMLQPGTNPVAPGPMLSLEQRMDRDMQQLSAVLQVAFSDTLPVSEGESTPSADEFNIDSLLNGAGLGTGEDSL